MTTPPRHYVLLFALAVLAAVFRIVPAAAFVWPAPGEVRFFEADPWFHVRQTHATVAEYPRISRWDRGSHYPSGERGMNQGLYDFSMATVSEVLGAGHPSSHLVDLVAAWTPVVLSVALVVLVYATARVVVPPALALLAAALLVVFPGSLETYSLVGFADHHIAEDCLAVWMCRALMVGVSRPLPWWRPAFLDALPLGVFLYTWPGAVAHLGIAMLAMAAMGLAACARSDAFPVAYPFRYAAAVALWFWPLSWAYPDAVLWPGVETSLGLLLIGMAVGGPVFLWSLAAWRTPRRSLGLLGMASLAGVAIAIGCSHLGQWALQMLFEPRSPLVAEQQPSSWMTWMRHYGLEGLWALAALPLLAGQIQRRRLPVVVWTLMAWGTAESFLWWHTYDFIYAPPPFLALLAAAALPEGALLRRRLLATVAVAAQAVCCLAGWTQAPWPTHDMVSELMIMNNDWAEAMQWLRTQTPPIPDLTGLGAFVDGQPRYPTGCYGVFAGWDNGEYVAGPGGRLALWSEDMSPDPARWLLLSDEGEAWEKLQGWAAPGQDVRYVVVDSRMAADFLQTEAEVTGDKVQRYLTRGPVYVVAGTRRQLLVTNRRYATTMVSRLYWGDGSGLGHFRLVHETPGQVLVAWLTSPVSGGWLTRQRTLSLQDYPELRSLADQPGVSDTRWGPLYDARAASRVKIFEAVPGATLVGTAPTEALVTATLEVHQGSRTWTYHQEGHSEANGRFQLRVSYSTDSRGAYRIECGGRLGTASVSDSQVHRGATVEVQWQ